jgi:hypothetical protein
MCFAGRYRASNGSLVFNSVEHSSTDRPDEGIYQCAAKMTSYGTIVSRRANVTVACKYKSCRLVARDIRRQLYASRRHRQRVPVSRLPARRRRRRRRCGERPRLMCRLSGARRQLERFFDKNARLPHESAISFCARALRKPFMQGADDRRSITAAVK